MKYWPIWASGYRVKSICHQKSIGIGFSFLLLIAKGVELGVYPGQANFHTIQKNGTLVAKLKHFLYKKIVSLLIGISCLKNQKSRLCYEIH